MSCWTVFSVLCLPFTQVMQPGFCHVVLAIFHFTSALAGMLLFRSA